MRFGIFIWIWSLFFSAGAYYTIPLTTKKLQGNHHRPFGNVFKHLDVNYTTNTVQSESTDINLKNIINGVGAIATVSVGTPEQKFNVLFDTGSDLFGIPSKLSPSTCKNKYEHLSKTYKPQNKMVTVSYLGGPKTFDLAEETVIIGGLAIDGATIGLSEDHCQEGIDGIMGMSLVKRPDISPIFDTLTKQKLLAAPIFSYILKTSYNQDSDGGELHIGGWDPKYIHPNGKINFHPVLTASIYGGWSVGIDYVSFGSKILSSKSTGILDTGTVPLMTHTSTVEEIIKSTSGLTLKDKWVQAPCSALNNIPDLIFIIGNDAITVPFRDLAFQRDGHTCNIAIMALDIGLPGTWVLGQVFSSHVYTIHDYQKKEVALVPIMNTPATYVPPRSTSATNVPPSETPATDNRPIPPNHKGGVSTWTSRFDIILSLFLLSILNYIL